LVGLLVLSFVLPPATFDAFRWVAMIGAMVFIVVQVIIWIDWAYGWNEEWVDKGYQKRVLACAVFNYAVSLVGMVLLFHFYANGSMCKLEQTFIGLTIGITLLFSLISIAEFCEHGAILPSSVCTLYCYWILYSALAADPDVQCNDEFLKKSDAQLIVGLIIAAISVAYNSFYASANSHALLLSSDFTSTKVALLSAPVKLVDEAPEPQDKDRERADSVAVSGAENKSARHFQFILTTGACYACMLLTDWGEAKSENSQAGWVSVWVQIVSQWLVMILYTWSLLAPYVLTSREF